MKAIFDKVGNLKAVIYNLPEDIEVNIKKEDTVVEIELPEKEVKENFHKLKLSKDKKSVSVLK